MSLKHIMSVRKAIDNALIATAQLYAEQGDNAVTSAHIELTTALYNALTALNELQNQ